MGQNQRLDLSAKIAFEQWWTAQTRKGDPARRPDLVRDAFLAAFEIGYASGNRYGWQPDQGGVLGPEANSHRQK